MKIKMALNWAGACGGCDVAILDLAERVLELADLIDFVYWPVAMDFKRRDLMALPEGSVDVGLFNGALRTSEHEDDAELLRQRCRILVAFGSCACFGGIPGLANQFDRQELLDRVYRHTPSTDNPGLVEPRVRTSINGHALTLPRFQDEVRSLDQAVGVDLFVPGCPPTAERVEELTALVAALANGQKAPPQGTVLASDKALCDECPRLQGSERRKIEKLHRPHEILADPDRCFLDQGLLCLGPATRGGCGQSCIRANMPCRGCFGPTPGVLDPGAEAMSALASLIGPSGEDALPPHKIKEDLMHLPDPLGLFYRFTLPKAIVRRRVKER